MRECGRAMWFHQEMNSIFYVDSDYESLSFNNSKMETEVRTLKQELARTRDALKVATKRCRDLVRELDSRTAGHESERCLRDQQLSRILRALLVLESRLKQEQKSIRQLLCEKDNVIRNQQLEIAKLRRYTKNYIKCKREQQNRTCQSCGAVANNLQNSTNLDNCHGSAGTNLDLSIEQDNYFDEIRDSELGKDIQRLKREIIDKLNVRESDEESTRELESHNREVRRQVPMCGVRKTNSFAGSDVSKESCASSSENTDAGSSILTTTTDESSPSLLSTEGFCEGESTDGSPGSTLNKSSLKYSKSFGLGIGRRTCSEGDNEIDTRGATRLSLMRNIEHRRDNDDDGFAKRRHGIVRAEPLAIYDIHQDTTKVTIPRTESKDDGMDCNFASDDDEEEEDDDDDEHEPIYVNSCNENNARNLRECKTKTEDTPMSKNGHKNPFDNNNEPSKLEQEEPSVEETSGNWYSDPDEDRISDDVFRHSTYRPNGNHNSVLECVNQILLRDMEEEESMLTAPRRFKHRGRIVRFQPARLSDIESVGSEMERRNSEEGTMDRDMGNETEARNFEATASEDEFGMKIEQDQKSRSATADSQASETSPEEELDDENLEEELVVADAEAAAAAAAATTTTTTTTTNTTTTTTTTATAAVPIVVIEPKVERIEAARRVSTSCLEMGSPRMRLPTRSSSPTLRMERIEEKTCLQMSSKGLTIAKNLDYEDIESLPEIIPPVPKTPPALPPKPTQFRNTLILKKIPSPSFLIDETRRKHPQEKIDLEASRRNIRGLSACVTPTKTLPNGSSARSLVFEERHPEPKIYKENANSLSEQNRFTITRSSFQAFDASRSTNVEKAAPIVTSMVRHFEEFKIGGDNDERNMPRERSRSKERRAQTEYDDFDIRQNFEEFNLDECDLSDDPDRPDGDGSERLANSGNHALQNENADNNNVIYNNTSNSNGIYDNFLEATGLSNKSILTPSRLLSNHKSMLKPKDVKYKNKIKANAVMEKHGIQAIGSSSQFTHVRHWTGPFV